MIQPGTEVFKIPDCDTAADDAKAFCKSRELNSSNAKIVRRGCNVSVIITAQCVLPSPKKPVVCVKCSHLYAEDGKCKGCNNG